MNYLRARPARPQTFADGRQANRWSWALLVIALVVLGSYVLPYIWRVL